ncbi:DKNYY domain-containing protein [Flavobacteriaceae bacterium F08102]|nr:DKNYY domain-containing protein [Flavobacteriaceae bacterium F08102]
MTEEFTFQHQKVYYKGTLIKGLSAENFAVIPYTDNELEVSWKCLRDTKGIWWFWPHPKKIKVKFLTKDIQNFTIINKDYAKDKEHVYLVDKDGCLIPNADAETFRVLEDTPYFSKDKHNLYALDSIHGLFIYKDADFESLVSIGWNQFITDKHHVYHFSSGIVTLSNDAKHIEIFDDGVAQTSDLTPLEQNKKYLLKKYPTLVGWWHPAYEFTIDSHSLNADCFYKTNNAIFYLYENKSSGKADAVLIEKADVSTFTILSPYYARDKNRVYCQHRTVEHVAIDSFKVLKDKLAVDEQGIFYNGFRVDCDRSSFEVVYEDGGSLKSVVAKDKDSVYCDQNILFGKVGMRTGNGIVLTRIKNADPMSFTMYSDLWAKDKNQVYLGLKPYKKAMAPSFEYLCTVGCDEWAKDHQFLYNGNGKRVVKGIDGATFRMLNKFWGMDSKNVFSFCTGGVRSSIDVKTFKIIDDKGGAEDKNYVYSCLHGEIKKKKK